MPPAPNIRQCLAHWACSHNVTHAALSDLLKLLKVLGLDVPLTAASLLKTPRNVEVQHKSGGDYINFGLAKSISSCLSTVPPDVVQSLEEIKLQINIDGLPLFKSSSMSVWPILCSFSDDMQLRSKPFPVAMFCGPKKPSNLDFLLDFVDESKMLYNDGLIFNERRISIKIICVICDAPAKAFVKGTVQFNGKYGCDRCVQKGEYSEGRMLFLHADAPSRSDDSFRRQENSEHHKHRSPFCDLYLDMINDFPIDYMHLVNLGVTKRLMLAWICGPLKSQLSSSQIDTISMNLLKLQSYMPKEFARRPRSLQYVRMWKATEFRQFLVYTGPIVLRKVLTDEYYVNFLSLSCAVSILLNSTLTAEHKDYADQLLKFFVHSSAQLYGQNFVTYNVHALMHLCEVAERYGCLEKCSAYPFESYMQTIKKYVRSTKNPLVQIARRLDEVEMNADIDWHLPPDNNTLDISASSPNNCFLMKDGKYCLCHEIVFGQDKVLCEVFVESSFLYDKPCDSRLLGIYKVKLKSSAMKLLPTDSLSKKAIFVRMNDTHGIILPFLHSY